MSFPPGGRQILDATSVQAVGHTVVAAAPVRARMALAAGLRRRIRGVRQGEGLRSVSERLAIGVTG